MQASEAVAIRERIGLTREDLAAEFGMTPDVVAAWETGRVKVSKRIARELHWRQSALDREAALTASGLAECAWMLAWEQEPSPTSLKAQTAYLERGVAHARSCPVCLEREKYIADRFPPMPPRPMPFWIESFSKVGDRVAKLPRWAQPGAWMGMAFGAYTFVQLFFGVPGEGSRPEKWIIAVGSMVLSVALGAAIGVVYGGIREWRARRT